MYTPAVAGSQVYPQTNAAAPVVLALDRATGGLVWQVPAIGGVGSPALTDGVVYEGGGQGGSGIVALDAATGQTRWTYPTGAAVEDEVVITSGTLIFGAGRG